MLAALDHNCRRFSERGADKHHRTRAAAAAAERHPVAVAFHHSDAVERNAEQVAQYLRIGRCMAHAEIERAGNDGHRAVGIEMDCAEFLAGRCRHFEITADAESAQQAALLAFALALLESGIVGRSSACLSTPRKSPQS